MYILKGLSYYALYAWIHQEDLARLQQHEAHLSRFVGALVANIGERKTTEMIRTQFSSQPGPDDHLDLGPELASPSAACGHQSSIRTTRSVKSGRGGAKSTSLDEARKSRGLQVGKRPSSTAAAERQSFEQLNSFDNFDAEYQSDGRSRQVSSEPTSGKHPGLAEESKSPTSDFVASETVADGYASSRVEAQPVEAQPEPPSAASSALLVPPVTRRESFSSFEVDLGGQPPVRGPAPQVLFSTESL